MFGAKTSETTSALPLASKSEDALQSQAIQIKCVADD